MTPGDILTRAAPPPDHVFRYGPGDDQIAELRLPSGGPWPAPLVVFLHGGFWRAAFDRSHTGPLAAALAAAGFAVCVPEFRRTGQAGGGWPGTFDDVAAAIDQVPALAVQTAGEDAVSSGAILLAGHSAGGHLALWAAARHRLPPSSPWHPATGAPTPGEAGPGSAVRGVVALAAVSDLRACHERHLGQDAVAELLGGGPGDQPDRYRVTDPATLLPVGCAIRLVHGSADDRVPCDMSHTFAAHARAAGDDVSLDELAGADHFDVIDPLSAAWPRVLRAFQSLADPAGRGRR